MSGTPTLWLLVGPNGAGKSTYYDKVVRPHFGGPFINADRIALERWPDAPFDHSVEAARFANELRQQMIVDRKSFATETVFSHPSRLAILQRAGEAGFERWVTWVGVEQADLAVARVRERVSRGGHPIPEDKIRARYQRMQALAREAVTTCERGLIVDNSTRTRPLRLVLTFERGTLAYRSPDLPEWVSEVFRDLLD